MARRGTVEINPVGHHSQWMRHPISIRATTTGHLSTTTTQTEPSSAILGSAAGRGPIDHPTSLCGCQIFFGPNFRFIWRVDKCPNVPSDRKSDSTRLLFFLKKKGKKIDALNALNVRRSASFMSDLLHTLFYSPKKTLWVLSCRRRWGPPPSTIGVGREREEGEDWKAGGVLISSLKNKHLSNAFEVSCLSGSLFHLWTASCDSNSPHRSVPFCSWKDRNHSALQSTGHKGICRPQTRAGTSLWLRNGPIQCLYFWKIAGHPNENMTRSFK